MLTEENLNNYKNIHIIGIGGVSMSAIAETLHIWGHNVTGSDAKQSDLTDKLVEHGIKVTIGHSPEDSKNADLVIYSAAIKEDDPDMVAAKEAGVPTVVRGEFVGLLTKLYKESICVAGTHGKSTTTSMISVCFLAAQTNPTIQVGAYLKNIDGNYKIGSNDYFILESCEYKESYLDFCPTAEIILDIDNDHLDYFGTFENVVKSFEKFSKKLPENGVLVTNADDENCLNLKNVVKCKFITYGINNKDADYRAENISFDDNGLVEYDLLKHNEFFKHVKLNVGGNHNVLNSIAVLAMCDHYGLDLDVCIEALKSFTGANRRLEFKGRVNGAPVFDDYAHHPTEIMATVNNIKNKKYHEDWVVFQPHTYTRTLAHLEDFAKALSKFDNVIMVEIYAARAQNTIGISSKDVINKIKEIDNTKNAIFISNFDEVVKYLKENVKSDDLVLTLGAGDVTEISDMLVK